MNCSQLICAENIILDFGSRRISAINLLQDAGILQFPFITQISVYVQIDKEINEEPTEVNLEVRLNGIVSSNNKINLTFGNNLNRCGTIIFLGLINIPSESILEIDVVNNGVVMDRYTVKYNKVENPNSFVGLVPPPNQGQR